MIQKDFLAASFHAKVVKTSHVFLTRVIRQKVLAIPNQSRDHYCKAHAMSTSYGSFLHKFELGFSVAFLVSNLKLSARVKYHFRAGVSIHRRLASQSTNKATVLSIYNKEEETVM